MESSKRKAHKTVSKKIPVQKVTAATQTEPCTEDPAPMKKFVRPKEPRQKQEQSPSRDEPATESAMGTVRHKACQTVKKSKKRLFVDSPLHIINTSRGKWRKQDIALARLRMQKLLEQINCDPPPSWEAASLMWLDVDVLEQCIAELELEEKEEAAKRPKAVDESSAT